MLAPIDVEHYLARIREYLAALEPPYTLVIATRTTMCQCGSSSHIHLYAGDRVEALLPTIHTVVEKPVSRLEPRPLLVASRQLTELLTSIPLVNHAEHCTRQVVERGQIGIIEA